MKLTAGRAAIVFGSLLTIAIALAGLRAETNDPKAVPPRSGKVLFPPNHAVIFRGTFHVIVEGGDGELTVDGKPQPWEPFAPPLRVAKIGLNPGMHEIQIGREKVEFCVGLSEEEHEGPRDWPHVRSHTMPAERRCAACHTTHDEGGKLALAPPRMPEACFSCHVAGDFESIHSAPVTKLGRCSECHDLHGSPRESLLNRRGEEYQMCRDKK